MINLIKSKTFMVLTIALGLQACCADYYCRPSYVDVYRPTVPVGAVGSVIVEEVYYEHHPMYFPPAPPMYFPPVGPPGGCWGYPCGGTIYLPFNDREPLKGPAEGSDSYQHASFSSNGGSSRNSCTPKSESICARWQDLQLQDHTECQVIRYGCEDLSGLVAEDIVKREDFVIVFAKAFDISVNAAKQVVNAFSDVTAGDLFGLSSIGLQTIDLVNLLAKRHPSEALVRRVSQNLGLAPQSAESLLVALQSYAVSQVEQSSSRLWQSCFSEGLWQTLDTLDCTDKQADGCSPETGAKLCFVAKEHHKLKQTLIKL